MAKPIRNTPILFGEDAKMFLAQIEKRPSTEERKRERARIARSLEELEALVKNLKILSSLTSSFDYKL